MYLKRFFFVLSMKRRKLSTLSDEEIAKILEYFEFGGNTDGEDDG